MRYIDPSGHRECEGAFTCDVYWGYDHPERDWSNDVWDAATGFTNVVADYLFLEDTVTILDSESTNMEKGMAAFYLFGGKVYKWIDDGLNLVGKGFKNKGNTVTIYDTKFAVNNLLSNGKISVENLKKMIPIDVVNTFKPSDTIKRRF
ncbi:hypothetical protein [Chengkuizengella marina]|uniref:hypothetical protein n=1 Tax=Chengkuizengella marina TaxID=2507566 RepID=UPI001F2A2407|nr:hypothetical protein [Chengkuizengella marina]